MKITKEQAQQVKGTGRTWKEDIIEHLKKTNGASATDLYVATRGEGLSEVKMKHNIASQLTYLRNDGYLLSREDEAIFLLAEPIPGTEELQVVPGMEARVRQLLRMPAEKPVPETKLKKSAE